MPLSRDPRARARQLANLTPRPPAPPAGNARARTHGGYAAVARERLDAKVREVYDALAADAPVRAADGGLPAADTVAVRLLADCLCRLDAVAANVRDYGLFDQESGNVRPVVELERRLRAEARDHADSLGMTPTSRAKLGYDLSRTASVAQAMSEPDAARRRDLMREAGLELEEADGE